MKLLLTFAFILAAYGSAQGTPIKILNDKTIMFSTATVDGIPVWSQAEKDQLEIDLTVVAAGTITAHTPVVVDLSASEFEVNISSIFAPFNTRQEYLDCQTKDGLSKSIQKIQAEISAADVLGETAKSDNLNDNLTWAVHYYGTL